MMLPLPVRPVFLRMLRAEFILYLLIGAFGIVTIANKYYFFCHRHTIKGIVMKSFKHLAIIAGLSFSINAFAYDYGYSDSTIEKQDAYGYGVHSDQYGRPVTIQPYGQ